MYILALLFQVNLEDARGRWKCDAFYSTLLDGGKVMISLYLLCAEGGRFSRFVISFLHYFIGEMLAQDHYFYSFSRGEWVER